MLGMERGRKGGRRLTVLDATGGRNPTVRSVRGSTGIDRELVSCTACDRLEQLPATSLP